MDKKSHPKFVVPGYGTKNRSRVQHRWRKQRGTDNKKRIARSGYGATPHIGYKNAEGSRFLRADGAREVLVHNEREIAGLVGKDMGNVVAVIAHDVSRRKRLVIQSFADKYRIRVSNRVIE